VWTWTTIDAGSKLICNWLSAESSEFTSDACAKRQAAGDLARRNPHDTDGVADHVGGALLVFGAFGINFARSLRRELEQAP
jgi:hypothetical protein